jgi:hypothetical protein
MPTPTIITAPWPPETVEALNRYQADRQFYLYTCCECGAAVVATKHGWQCPRGGGIVQKWAYVDSLVLAAGKGEGK